MKKVPSLPPELFVAARSLRRTPGFTAIVIVILALGIGGSTAVFSVVNQVLLKPLPYSESGQLVRLYQTRTYDPEIRGSVSPPAFAAYRRMRSFEGAAATVTTHDMGADVTGDHGPERVRRLPVTSSYFEALGALPVLGRGFLREEEVPGEIRRAVISHRLWQQVFGGAPDVLAGTLIIDAEPFEIVGVAPPDLVDPVVGAVDVWVPLQWTQGGAQNHYLTVYARLAAGTSLEHARAELRQTDRALAEEYPDAADRPAYVVGLHDDVVGAASRTLYVLLGAVGLVLLIVCLDTANLLLARATAREREFAVRAALGSGRGRIAGQLLFESLLLGLAGGVAGVLLAAFLLDAIIVLGSASIPRLAETAFDGRVLAFSAAVSIGSALLFGLLPALRYANVAAAGVLRGAARSVTPDRGRNRLRAVLVGAQVSLAFVLLVGASILMLSFQRLQNVDLGIEVGDALTFELNLPAARYDSVRRAAFQERLATRLGGLPGVGAVGGVSRLPTTGGHLNWGTRPGSGPLAGREEGFFSSQQRAVSGDYFAAMRIPLVMGRIFDERDDMSAPHRVVISRSAAQAAFPGADPIGQTLVLLGNWFPEVIGVVEDVALTPEGTHAPTVYHPHRQFAGNRNWALTQVVRTHGDPIELLPAVRAEVATLDPELVVHRPQALAEALGEGIAQQRFTTFLMTGFAALAVLLAALGLFGVITYVVRQRRREIGIRAALGARPEQIRRMVLGQGLGVTVIGVAVGLLAAVAVSRVLRALVFETEPADPWVLAAAAVAMTAVAALATYLPAREATGIDPASVLQEE